MSEVTHQSRQQSKRYGKPGNPAWQKGVSGNPSGKSKTPPDIKALCQAMTEESVRTLVKCMRDDKAPWATRKDVAQFLIERAHGRAPIAPEDREANQLQAFSLAAALQRISNPQPVVSPPVIDVTPQPVGDEDSAK